ncbi:MAG: M4 family metallopeptidase [Myxococcaceae bacterium]
MRTPLLLQVPLLRPRKARGDGLTQAPCIPLVNPESFRQWTDEGLELAKSLQTRVSPERDRLARLRIKPGRGDSFYSPTSRTASIGSAAIAKLSPERARLETLETTIHEGTHHQIREAVGFPGLLAGFGPGRVGEGVAQVVAALALALEGKNPAERAHGMSLLDPSWQTTRVGEFKRRAVPLSSTADDLRSGVVRWWEDMGGVHVHGGIVSNAHRVMVERIGLEPTATVTFEAIEGLRRTTGIKGWARLTVRAAEHRFGVSSFEAQAVRDAWADVRIAL